MAFIVTVENHLGPVARELSSGGGGEGPAQLTFANVVHNRKKPRVPPNLVFSSVLGHLSFPFGLFTDKNETKI